MKIKFSSKEKPEDIQKWKDWLKTLTPQDYFIDEDGTKHEFNWKDAEINLNIIR